ncbi:MAG: SdpI family protein [Actinobacteria bacterium]|nr:SdpI family protein [Actinomycetota bacterium]
MVDYIGTLMSGVTGILFVVLGIPLVLEKVPPNYIYGARINKYVFQDKEIWYAVNKETGQQISGYGVVLLLIAGTTVPFIGNVGAQLITTIAVGILMLVLAIVLLVRGIKTSNRMAVEKGLRSKDED